MGIEIINYGKLFCVGLLMSLRNWECGILDFKETVVMCLRKMVSCYYGLI